VIVDKPNAVMFAECASVRVTRSDKDYPSTALESRLLTPDSHVAYIAIGSNLGNRADFIEKSIAILKTRGSLILGSSYMYESDPMYVTDQPAFLNCVIKIHTLESPTGLLYLLQQIEAELGRQSLAIRETNGPRPIDLDILFYDKIIWNEPDLIIPHPRLQERLFVLKPLVEYHPFTLIPVSHLALSIQCCMAQPSSYWLILFITICLDQTTI
jgi:dihydroneopterin aldolase/2-amino-4-hydroxy-6-hydroxymethyldihydropteridine diphosphokinase/dihydropteroate synthase